MYLKLDFLQEYCGGLYTEHVLTRDVNNLKKNHVLITAEKEFGKILQLLLIKTLSKIGTERKH